MTVFLPILLISLGCAALIGCAILHVRILKLRAEERARSELEGLNAARPRFGLDIRA